MKTIHKYILKGEYVELPKGAEVLRVGAQGDVPVLWALVDDETALERKQLDIVATGGVAEAVSTRRYLGTFQLENGLVGHVFWSLR